MTDAEILQAAAEWLRYDASSGTFTAIKSHPRRKAGDVAGFCMANGYIGVSVLGRQFYAHRLAWMFVYGQLPGMKIDHINGIRHDNRIANLREATDIGNAENIRKPHRDSSTGLLGVTFERSSGRYQAQLTSMGKKWCARFATAEEAHAAYLAKKREMHALCTI